MRTLRLRMQGMLTLPSSQCAVISRILCLPQHTAQNVVQEVYLPTKFPLFPLDVDAGAVPVQEVSGHCTTVAAIVKELRHRSAQDY